MVVCAIDLSIAFTRDVDVDADYKTVSRRSGKLVVIFQDGKVEI